MKRPKRWFRDYDGKGFFRNSGCVEAERRELERRRFVWHRHEKIMANHDEWMRIWRAGPDRKDALGPGDVEIPSRSFREAYPNHPGLWVLDEKRLGMDR